MWGHDSTEVLCCCSSAIRTYPGFLKTTQIPQQWGSFSHTNIFHTRKLFTNEITRWKYLSDVFVIKVSLQYCLLSPLGNVLDIRVAVAMTVAVAAVVHDAIIWVSVIVASHEWKWANRSISRPGVITKVCRVNAVTIVVLQRCTAVAGSCPRSSLLHLNLIRLQKLSWDQKWEGK